MAKKANPGTPSVLERQIRVLEQIALAPRDLSFSDLKDALDLPNGTVHRLLSGLCAAGLVETSSNSVRLYRLGGRLKRLLGLSVSKEKIIPVARPIIKQLVDRFGETAFLAMLKGSMVETVTMVTPVKDWQGHVHPGRIMPAHAAASAKAIIAFQDSVERKAALSEPLQSFTPKTLASVEAVEKQYAEIRESRIASCHEEIDPGQLAYAAPVEMAGADIIFSVCLVGPTERMLSFGKDEIISALQSNARELSGEFANAFQN